MRLLIAVVLSAIAASAQLENDTITVTALTLVDGRADDLQVSLLVVADIGIGLDDILKALLTLGVTEKNLVSALQRQDSSSCDGNGVCSGPPDYVEWMFSYTQPFSQLRATISALEAVTVASHSGIRVRFTVAGGPLAATALGCDYGALVAQARGHAESVASAAALRIGAVMAMSDGSAITHAPSETVPSVNEGVGTPGAPPSGTVVTSPRPGGGPASCTAVVQFQLLR